MMKYFFLGLLAAQTALSMRFVMYIDQYVPLSLLTIHHQAQPNK